MRKHIANLLTASRILFSILLLFPPVTSPFFLLFYLLCGLSDLLDGPIARRTNAVTPFGARLDTFADILFTAAALFKLLPHLSLPLWLWLWILSIAFTKLSSILLHFLRQKKFFAHHSPLNKAIGFLLFFLPPVLLFLSPTIPCTVLCTLATLSAAQELSLVLKSPPQNINEP